MNYTMVLVVYHSEVYGVGTEKPEAGHLVASRSCFPGKHAGKEDLIYVSYVVRWQV